MGKNRAGDRSLYTENYRRLRRRQTVGWAVVAVGVFVGFVHVMRHLGALDFLPLFGWQDLATGYPLAIVFVVAGFAMILREASEPN